MFTDDVEFYHDVTGMSAGQQVRDEGPVAPATAVRRPGWTDDGRDAILWRSLTRSIEFPCQHGRQHIPWSIP
jgi:hypothetical protein